MMTTYTDDDDDGHNLGMSNIMIDTQSPVTCNHLRKKTTVTGCTDESYGLPFYFLKQ